MRISTFWIIMAIILSGMGYLLYLSFAPLIGCIQDEKQEELITIEMILINNRVIRSTYRLPKDPYIRVEGNRGNFDLVATGATEDCIDVSNIHKLHLRTGVIDFKIID